MNEHEILSEIKERKKLLVYRSVKDHKKGAFAGLGLIAMIAIVIFSHALTSFPTTCMADVIWKAVIEGVLWCILVFLTLFLVYTSFFCRYSDPIAILDREGIWISNFGFIPWSNMAGPRLFYVNGNLFFGFDLKDERAVRKSADLIGKITLKLPRLRGAPRITLSGTNVPLDLILVAVRYYMGR